MNLKTLDLVASTTVATVPSAVPAHSSCPLVLAVDDDEDSLHLIHAALELFGFSNIGTCSALEAIQLAQVHRPRLILLDILMPELNGFDVVEQLKQHPETQDIPVVAVTVLAKPEDQQLLLQSGFDDCLIKPYSLDDLEATLSRHLDCETFTA